MILSEKEAKRLKRWKKKRDKKPPDIHIKITVVIIRKKNGEHRYKKIAEILEV